MGASRLRDEADPADAAEVRLPAHRVPDAENVADAMTDAPPDAAQQPRCSTTFGRYIFIEEIGRDRAGIVLRAYDPSLEREIAVKVIRPEGVPAELHRQALERMLREVQATAKLSHPNIAAIYDAEIVGDELVIALEHVRGTTLPAWLHEWRPWREVVAMFEAAGRGLAAAHAAGFLHGDFRAASVFVGEDGRARVTDFGIYLAPVSGNAHRSDRGATAHSDQYAFCVALWEGLTRQRLHIEAGEAPAWPRDVQVPASIRQALVRGLAADPTHRWPSMEALLERLADAPADRQRVWSRVGGAAVCVALGGMIYEAQRQRLAERCSGGRAQVAEAWGHEQKELVRQAMNATRLPYAAQTWESVAVQLDAYADAWAAMHKETCEATTVRDEQPLAVMDLRMACLHRARVDLRALTDVLREADADVVEKAMNAAGALPDLQRCGDVTVLQAQVPPPAPAEQELVESIRVELAAVRALHHAGKLPQALELIAPLSMRAEAVTYAPLHTELKAELGATLRLARRYPEAEAALRDALKLALQCRQWREAALIASNLIHVAGWAQARPREGLAYAETARGLLVLAGEGVEAELRTEIGNILQTLGRDAEAEAEHRAAVTLGEALWGAESVDVAVYHANLAETLVRLGRLEEAEQENRVELALQEQAFGPDHPLVASSRYSLGNTLYMRGRYEDAEVAYRAALAAQARTLGEDHPDTAMTRQSLGNSLAARGLTTEAEAEYRAALRVQERVLGPGHIHVAVTRLSLVNPLGAQGRFAEAEHEARLAVDALSKAVGDQHYYSVIGHSQLGLALQGQQRYAEAEAELRLAVSLGREVLGHEHSQVGRVLEALGSVLHAQGRDADAAMELKAALQVRTRALGEAHPETMRTRTFLGRVLLAERRYEEAESLYAHALSLQTESAGFDPNAAELRTGFGRALLGRGRIAEARSELEQASARWQHDEQVVAPTRARLAFAFAQALASGRNEEGRAVALAREARALFETSAQIRERDEVEAWLRARNTARTRRPDDSHRAGRVTL